ncbi:MAG: hypothetical protein JWQ87_5471 [Candidatus Sulfotelmatobacter sp.]|nr:hypothetical protein [Candidatus Sulfotelmatobacter sp.]
MPGVKVTHRVALSGLRRVLSSTTATPQEIIDASRLYAQIQGILPTLGRPPKSSPKPETEVEGINRLMAHVEEQKPS